MQRKNVMFIVVSLFLLTSAFMPTAANAQYHQDFTNSSNNLSIGIENLPETKEVTELSTGVTHTKIIKGIESHKAFYTAEIDFYQNKSDAQQMRKDLREKGFKSSIQTIRNPGFKHTDIGEKTIGHVLQSGEFSAMEEAEQRAQELRDHGFPVSRIAYSEYNGTLKSTGPWVINVLEINPDKFDGELQTRIGHDQIQGNETLSSMAKGTDSIAAVNGGYFVVGSGDGTPGSPAGLSVLDGTLLSESVGERTSLILNQDQARIAKAKTALLLETDNDETREIDGINRVPGLIRSCGGINDEPSNLPMHDVTCTDNDEIIQYTEVFGESTPSVDGYEIVLDEENNIISAGESKGTTIPENGSILLATGEAADWLQSNSNIGEEVTMSNNILVEGETQPLKDTTDIINGAPQLLKDGEIDITADKEGFHWSSDFYYNFGLYRHPRTLAGIKDNGNLLFVTIDGRNPGTSIGLSFYESAQLLKDIGATEGMNLDGGGSTTMTINQEVTNNPSGGAQRAVADGIFIVE
ncbi:Predicted protein [Lentibacillus halodurans]|uniref:SPOR domain-containing protein n=1 Tax=Lentibacillus halodurans TaxID=237679 RepID=A0A1I0YDH9_9BACI|nr:phosphodiester glycosidase family protein [Lentibacillus halodurans]SFB10857.1 Predicted protein [Lentibacillus halodurans]